MTHGIQQETPNTNIDHLGFRPDMLLGAMDSIDQELGAHGDVAEAGVIDALAVTREVRHTMEQVLALLNDALPANCR
ncbi:MAG: hypothetical protein WBG92_10825 [Thiohalocapsa sp.]